MPNIMSCVCMNQPCVRCVVLPSPCACLTLAPSRPRLRRISRDHVWALLMWRRQPGGPTYLQGLQYQNGRVCRVGAIGSLVHAALTWDRVWHLRGLRPSARRSSPLCQTPVHAGLGRAAAVSLQLHRLVSGQCSREYVHVCAAGAAAKVVGSMRRLGPCCLCAHRFSSSSSSSSSEQREVRLASQLT